MKNNSIYNIAECSLSKLILNFSSTILISLVFNAVYSLTDALFISRGVGDNAMGSVSITFPFIILQGAISQTVGSGAASIVSRMLGKHDTKGAGNATFNAMFVFYITATIVTILGFITVNPVLHILGVTDELFVSTKTYYLILLVGNVFSTGFSSIIRAEGKMTYGLLIWVIPISINIVFDAIFVLVFGWGVAGSAVATVVSWFISFLMSVIFFVRFSVQDFSDVKLNIKSLGEIIGIGLPTFIQMCSLSVMTIMMNNMLSNIGGTSGINAFAYISKIMQFVIIPFTAFSLALSPIAGFCYGARNEKRALKALNLSAIYCEIYSVFIMIILVCVPHKFVEVFTQNGGMILLSSQGLKIIAISVFFTPVPMLLGSYYQAIGKKLFAFLFYILTPLLLFLICLLFHSLLDMKNILWYYNISHICSAFISIVIHLAYIKAYKK